VTEEEALRKLQEKYFEYPHAGYIKISDVANLPSRFGTYKVIAFQEGHKEHLVIYKNLSEEIPIVRVHSECLTGDAIGSLKCDCRDQLEFALHAVYFPA